MAVATISKLLHKITARGQLDKTITPSASWANGDTITYASIGLNWVDDVWIRASDALGLGTSQKVTVDNVAKTITNSSGGALAAGDLRVIGH